MTWLILTFASSITGSLTRILQKTLLKDEQSDPFAFGFIFQLLVSIMFLLFTLVTGTFELPSFSGIILNMVVMAIFYSLGNLGIFMAFKNAQASEVSIILASSTVWSVIAALIMLGESLTRANLLGIILIVLGVIAVNYRKTKWQLGKGHLYALVAAVLFGVAFTNDAYIINRYNSVASYMVIAFALPGTLTLALSPKSIKKLKYFTKLTTFRNLVLCCVLYALSAITIFSAYKLGGQASIISPIQQTSIVFTVILSYFILKEKDRVLSKSMGAVLAFAGVLLLI